MQSIGYLTPNDSGWLTIKKEEKNIKDKKEITNVPKSTKYKTKTKNQKLNLHFVPKPGKLARL